MNRTIFAFIVDFAIFAFSEHDVDGIAAPAVAVAGTPGTYGMPGGGPLEPLGCGPGRSATTGRLEGVVTLPGADGAMIAPEDCGAGKTVPCAGATTVLIVILGGATAELLVVAFCGRPPLPCGH